MYIDKYFKKDGYYDEYGCFYGDAKSFIATSIFGFCGCGMPNEALEYVRKSLQLVDDLTNLVFPNIISYEDWEKRKKQVFSDNGAEYLMWYFLNEKELTQHGSSVPGWLTQKGIELLSDINKLNNKN